MNKLQDYLNAWKSGQVEPPVTKLIGIRLIDSGDGNAKVEMHADSRHHNPMGIVHGGILCDLSDAAMGIAMASTLINSEGFSTIELNIHYFRPVTNSTLIASASVLRRGGNIAYLECDIVDEENRSIAKASSTCLIQRIPTN